MASCRAIPPSTRFWRVIITILSAPSGRRSAWLEQGYASLDWPFAPLAGQREFALSVEWELPQLLGYLGTWSAARQYQQQHGHDPRGLIDADLRLAWGDADRRTIRWPLSLRVGRKVADEPSS